MTDDLTIIDLLPTNLRFHYLSLVNRLPIEFHRRRPDLSKMNPYCVALDVHLLQNPLNVDEDVNENVANLDTFIGLEAKSKGKVWGFIEQPPCYPLYQMPLIQVSRRGGH